MLVKGANPIAVGSYRKEVYTFLRNAAPIIHWIGDFEDLHTQTLCYSEKGQRENVIAYTSIAKNDPIQILPSSVKVPKFMSILEIPYSTPPNLSFTLTTVSHGY